MIEAFYMKNCLLNLVCLVVSVLSLSCSSSKEARTKKSYVDFELISTLRLNDSIPQKQIKNRGFVIHNEDQLKFLLNDSNGVYYYDFRNQIDYSIFDFKKFDYVISRSSEIDSLSHSEYYTKTMDFCSNKKLKALEVKHKPSYNGSLLFIYQLKEKGKYRSPCP